jgi:hypothetical protein
MFLLMEDLGNFSLGYLLGKGLDMPLLSFLRSLGYTIQRIPIYWSTKLKTPYHKDNIHKSQPYEHKSIDY